MHSSRVHTIVMNPLSLTPYSCLKVVELANQFLEHEINRKFLKHCLEILSAHQRVRVVLRQPVELSGSPMPVFC